MKIFKNQKGFAGIEIALVIVALVAVGAAGYFAYQARQDHTDYSVNIAHHPKPVQPKTTYFEVKQQGYKMVLPQGLNDLTYVVQVDASGSQLTSFSTTSLSKLDANCSAAKAGLGSTVKVQTQDAANPFVIKKVAVGNSYIQYFVPDGPPCSNDPSVSKDEDLLKQALDSAVPL